MSISTVLRRCASDLLRQCNSSLMPQANIMLVGPRRLYSSARSESCKGTHTSIYLRNYGYKTPQMPPPNEKVATAAEERILHKMDRLDSVLEKRGIMLNEILRLVKRRNIIRARCKLALLGASILGAGYYAKKHLFSGSQDQAGGANPSSLAHHQLDNTSPN